MLLCHLFVQYVQFKECLILTNKKTHHLGWRAAAQDRSDMCPSLR